MPPSLESLDCVEEIIREEAMDCDFSAADISSPPAAEHFDDSARQAEVIRTRSSTTPCELFRSRN